MACVIQLPRSANAGYVPPANTLPLGTLFINYADGFLYFIDEHQRTYQLQATIMPYAYQTINANGVFLNASAGNTTLSYTFTDSSFNITSNVVTNTVNFALNLVDGALSNSVTQAPTANALNAVFSVANSAAQQVAAVKKTPTSCTSSVTLTTDPALTITLTPGWYDIELWLSMYETASGAGGFKFDLGGGTAAVANLTYNGLGFSNAVVTPTAAYTSLTTVTAITPLATAPAAPSWVLAKGSLTVTVAGTLALRWGQNAVNASPVNLLQGSYLKAMKIG